MVLGCQNDELKTPIGSDWHKELVGIMVVITDIFCISIITYFYYKLRDINNEYLDIIESLNISLKDYAVYCENLKIDNYS